MYGRSIIGEYLRTGIDRRTSCLLLLVVLCLIGLEFRDSHLVISSLYSLVLSLFVINFFFVLFYFFSFLYNFFFFFLTALLR